MLSFFLSIPETTPRNVLLFLHGVGEAFLPLRDLVEREDVVKSSGVRNLFNHGVPKILSTPGQHLHRQQTGSQDSPPFSLPLFKDFLVIAPQMFLREDMADNRKVNTMMGHACSLAKSVTGPAPRIAVMGFSRGGFAALQLAERLEVRALVTMDAAAPKGKEDDFARAIASQTKPKWAFFADYEGCDADFADRITRPHRRLDVPEIAATVTRIPGATLCKTLVPTDGNKVEKHNCVCDFVSSFTMVYEWIRKQLEAS
jgi:predicted esterase